MSFMTTGTSAEAITWAISPPIVPAPSTAALNTNIGRQAIGRRAEGALRLAPLRDVRGHLAVGGAVRAAAPVAVVPLGPAVDLVGPALRLELVLAAPRRG